MQALQSRFASSARLMSTVAVLALIALACGGSSGSQEYKDPNEQALFRIPDGWHLYESEELAPLASIPLVSETGSAFAVIDQVAFDGAPGRSVENLRVEVASAQYPVGAFSVRSVTAAERDLLSRQTLEQTVLPANAASQPIVSEDKDFGRDYSGIRRFLTYTDTTTSQRGVVYFVSVTSPDDSRIYSMAAGCSDACWETHQTSIQEVVDSWLVNTKQ